MGLPGGRFQADDEDLLATAIRETREELSLTLNPTSLLGVLDDVSPKTPIPRPVVVRPFIFAIDGRPALQPNDEVALVLWVPLTELRKAGSTGRLGSESGGRPPLPAYHLGDHVVWGLTERILTPLLDLLDRQGDSHRRILTFGSN